MPASYCWFAALIAVAASVLWLLAHFKLRAPVLFDLDEYYHLAVSRRIMSGGFPASLPFKFSMLGEFYADKDLLLHIITIPFLALCREPLTAAKLASLFMDAALLAALFALLRRYAGNAAAVLGAAVLSSPIFLMYSMYLRPAAAAIILTLAGLHFMAGKRKWPLFAVCALFALAHVSAFTMLFFAVVCEAIRYARDREFCMDTVAYSLLGLAAGYLVHPNFPLIVAVTYINAFLTPFYSHSGLRAAFGGELLPLTTAIALKDNVAVFTVFLIMLWGSFALRPKLSLATMLFTAAAQSYLALAFASARFWHQALPLALLAAAAFWRDISESAPERKRARTLLAGAWIAMLAVSIPPAFLNVSDRVRRKTEFALPVQQAAQWLEGRLPSGELIYHSMWSDSHILMFYNPDLTYINALDPMYMYYVKPKAAEVYDMLGSGMITEQYKVIRDVFGAKYGFTLKIAGFHKRVAPDKRFRTLFENSAAVIFTIDDSPAAKK
ncbi:MAG: hypothetical protein WC421_08135 [Elusimicrobiales bacterium]